ncbi:MAG: tyrosine-type recombinase/integrase [Deltaproteobacteria bacterium]|nr:tyrosine-type recombinase/integrase [Deltaproteobacteria bacterium]
MTACVRELAPRLRPLTDIAFTLTATGAERVLGEPDIKTPIGLRDRAILETLYSTGIRRSELVHLALYDLDVERGTLMVRHGKGGKDRMVPIGDRAVAWIERYLAERSSMVVPPDPGNVFLTLEGKPISEAGLSEKVRAYVEASGIGKKGSCHLMRHTCATLMVEGGADIRFVQELLGHVRLDTTQIYTHVSIRKLKQVHSATHPGAKLERRNAEDEER